MKYLNSRIHGELKNAEYLDKNGFFFGNDHRDLSDKIKYVRKVIG
jgi:CDP-6-deoxy-D-xylo-4-hexulose-3-dehydrase